MSVGAGENLTVDDFEHGLSPEWQVKEFQGLTDYKVVDDGSSMVLQAESHGTASALIYQNEYLLKDYPVISWRWKIESIVEGGDATSKQSDDYAARIYVIFPHWFYPKTKSLNYIWANRLEKGSILPSVYTGNAMLIAQESGAGLAGSWQSVRRNIAEDYRRAFGEDPPGKMVIAIMTDTDNTGGKARAWYDDIQLLKK
jgi:hypothetical protein